MFSHRLSPGKHTAPVWQIQWIEKERGSGEDVTEKLISISTDGRVTQWSIRKGFESYGMLIYNIQLLIFNDQDECEMAPSLQMSVRCPLAYR
jgi:hypothetical protein